MKFKKARLYTRNNSAGVPVPGYRSVFGDIANCLNYVTYLCNQDFNVQSALQFSEPDSNAPAARPPKPDDPDFAEKMAAHEQHKKFSEAWRECGLVKKDFSEVVSAVSALLGEDLFSYVPEGKTGGRPVPVAVEIPLPLRRRPGRVRLFPAWVSDLPDR